MRVVFRVDGGSKIGMGHLIRCLALAQVMAEYQYDVLFIVRQQSAELARRQHDWYGRLKVIPSTLTQAQELSWLAAQQGVRDADILIVDGYQFDQDYRRQVAELPPLLVLMDDTNNSGPLYGAMVINPAEGANELGYQQTAPAARLCLGGQYRLLRDSFVHLHPMPMAQRKDLSIMFGGSDPLNLTLPILQQLEKMQVTMPIRVVTGAAYNHQAEMERFVQRSALNIQYLPDCQQVADVMNRSRLMLSAAGGSQFELQACQTPSLLVIVAENQRLASTSAARQGCCEVVDLTGSIDINGLCQQLVALWQDQSRLSDMHAACAKYKDTEGGYRLVKQLAELVSEAK